MSEQLQEQPPTKSQPSRLQLLWGFCIVIVGGAVALVGFLAVMFVCIWVIVNVMTAAQALTS
ncbi:hypothetical protein [Cellulomonas sp. URHD0024]|uniref:hypothetical protein n=1 Tax=Cellulomonas sp. URHD0024 TaxID=1302620 RepID=UPI0012DC6FF0|nr:hypothetical protein [Cellulomonas sp. URHD0024]